MKLLEVSLTSLKQRFDVRQSLNQDHVIRLAELYEAKVALPPLVITPEFEIIDGRHRYEALKLNDATMARCEVRKYSDSISALQDALLANLTFGLPPTTQDIVLTFQQLIEQGVTQTRFRELFAAIPPPLIRKYYNTAHHKITDRKKKRAMEMIANGGTLEEAAKAQKINPKVLKDAISYVKRKTTSADVKGGFETKHRSMSASTARVLKYLIQGWEDGEISTDAVRDILSTSISGAKRYLRTVEEWSDRFENLVKKV